MRRRHLILIPLLVAFAASAWGTLRSVLNRPRRIGDAVIRDPEEHTVTDPETGAVRSIQGADITFPVEEVERIWDPNHLERLARTYWAYLTLVTLGFVRIYYTDGERYVCLLIRQLPLLTFQKPEYQMDANRGIVRWRIEKGLLVSRRYKGGDGYLEIDVMRCPPDSGEDPSRVKLHAEVEIANFYPRLQSGISNWFYANTQSRIHVLVCHGFLRSLARLDLAESKVGRFATVEEVPDTPSGGQLQGAERAAGPLAATATR